ncbi:MAG: hypothetical protein DMF99_19100 [Acidobacteria bacterium]|nr:MAG: hypothetical protein DMF99_19100 [Acidobacteriota bacterium]
MSKIRFNLNGKPVEASYEPGMHFLEVLREELGVVSAKNGCAPEGSCGCCLVMIDGHPALSCLRKPEQMEGRDVVTVEGLSEEMRASIGDAFVLVAAPGTAASSMRFRQRAKRTPMADGCRATSRGAITSSAKSSVSVAIQHSPNQRRMSRPASAGRTTTASGSPCRASAASRRRSARRRSSRTCVCRGCCTARWYSPSIRARES